MDALQWPAWNLNVCLCACWCCLHTCCNGVCVACMPTLFISERGHMEFYTPQQSPFNTRRSTDTHKHSSRVLLLTHACHLSNQIQLKMGYWQRDRDPLTGWVGILNIKEHSIVANSYFFENHKTSKHEALFSCGIFFWGFHLCWEHQRGARKVLCFGITVWWSDAERLLVCCARRKEKKHTTRGKMCRQRY